MGRKPKSAGREISGILLLDKPAGMTSNQVLQYIKKIFQARKAGHTGSLDKLATGLLPICLGEATKFSAFLLNADKCYLATITLGTTTTTGDTAGEILRTQPVTEISRNTIKQILEQFTGRIQQTPPMYSALKHKGQRLYKLAYQGKEVARDPREVTVHELELLRAGGNEIELRITCSKGTYIRTLAEDIGEKLGCGAHIRELRRIAAGPFTTDGMVTVTDVEQAESGGFPALDRLLQSMDGILSGLPPVYLHDNLMFYLRQGQAVIVPKSPVAGMVRIYDDAERFQGIGEVLDDGRISPRRLVHA